MSELYFEKYANFDRINEPVRVSIPFKKGAVASLDSLQIFNDEGIAPLQHRGLGFWNDGSVKWAKVDFMANLPANKSAVYDYDFNGKKQNSAFKLKEAGDILEIENGCKTLILGNTAGKTPFINFAQGSFSLSKIDGPYILDNTGEKHTAILTEPWQIEEEGAVMLKISAKGKHKGTTDYMDFILTLCIYANTSWFEVGYRIINRMDAEFTLIKKIAIDLHFDGDLCDSRSIATSNYLSDIKTETGERNLRQMIDADYLLYSANEHIPETFYGTFFADWNSKNRGGICATHYQAYQNFPKALSVSKDLLSIEILPEEYGTLKYYRGMAKNHTLFFHLHSGTENMENINKRSLMLQHMDKPILPVSVYEESGCYPNFFPKKKWPAFEATLMQMADNRGRAYGMLHWGDCPDMGYSQQGRGNGDYVWTNNEYDLPIAAMQLYARSGVRRMLDYVLVCGAHWVDIDVCHHDPDPLRHGAQVEHSRDHVTGNVEISHEWVDGLFAYYYQTGDRFAYETVIGIGHNIMRHLDEPRYHQKGGINARETGWALRALITLYIETNNDSWLKHADFIVSHFTSWKDTYGGWFSPYTDHTNVRVPFMISIAVVSLMKYYRVKADENIKTMIIEAMDDLIENALLENGLFYYKELPGLSRSNTNPITMEALACAYELTGDEKYLRAGIANFKHHLSRKDSGPGKKDKIKDGVLLGGPGPKGFAQTFPPLTFYYYHMSNTEILKELT